MTNPHYTTQLQAGLGMFEETHILLDLWQNEMTAADLQRTALEAGRFPNVSARRLRNIVTECFAPRYLSQEPAAAAALKRLQPELTKREFEQLLFIFTCRANHILADFIRQVYWPAYISGRDTLDPQQIKEFVHTAVQQGQTTTAWSETTINRVSGYLSGACADFGLLDTARRRRIVPFRIEQTTSIFLAHDLHFAGLGDNSIITHPDWALFGLTPTDVLAELRRLALKDWFIIQAAANIVRISWTINSMEELINALARR